MNPLFIIDKSLFSVMSVKDVQLTRIGMMSAGLWHPPADKIDLRVNVEELGWWLSGQDVTKWKAEEIVELEFGGSDYDLTFFDIGVAMGDSVRVYDHRVRGEGKLAYQRGRDSLVLLLALLVCALAVRNVEKETFQRKPGKFTRDGRPKHTHITTLRVPNVRYLPDDPDRPSTGRNVRAHFRRGHIREQRHGIGLSEQKKIWIDPIFVKADADFLPQKEYRVRA